MIGTPRSRAGDAVLVFLLLLFAYGYFSHNPGWNGLSRLALVYAVVEDGTLSIDRFHEWTGDKALVDGHYYSDKAIGASMLGVIVYAPLHLASRLVGLEVPRSYLTYLLTVLVIGIPSALAGGLLYRMASHSSGNRRRALGAVLAISLGTLILPYSMVFFGHALAGALLVTAFFLLWQVESEACHAGPGRLFLAGVLAGWAIITEPPTSVLVVPLAVYGLSVLASHRRARDRSRWSRLAIPGALGALLPIAVMLAYNSVCFGGPLTTGYALHSDEYFRTAMSQGLMGIGWPRLDVVAYMTIHPAHGVLWQSPVLVLCLVGLFPMAIAKRTRAASVTIGTMTALYVLLFSGFFMWWGGFAVGMRHLVPFLPFLALPLVHLPSKAFAVSMVLGAGSAIQMGVVSAGRIDLPDTLLTRLGELGYFEYSTIYGEAIPRLFAGRFVNSLGTLLLGLGGWSSLGLYVLVVAAGTGCLLYRFSPESH